jgi:hypothetical protein
MIAQFRPRLSALSGRVGERRNPARGHFSPRKIFFRDEGALLLLIIATVCWTAAIASAAEYRRYIVLGGVPTMTPFGFQPGMKRILEIYSFRPDGSYLLWRDNEDGAFRDNGTYQVSGDRVILRGSQGETTGLIASDGSSVKIGGNIYQRIGASSSTPSATGPVQPPTQQSCPVKCGEIGNDCDLAGRPHLYCLRQVNACMVACR